MEDKQRKAMFAKQGNGKNSASRINDVPQISNINDNIQKKLQHDTYVEFAKLSGTMGAFKLDKDDIKYYSKFKTKDDLTKDISEYYNEFKSEINSELNKSYSIKKMTKKAWVEGYVKCIIETVGKDKATKTNNIVLNKNEIKRKIDNILLSELNRTNNLSVTETDKNIRVNAYIETGDRGERIDCGGGDDGEEWMEEHQVESVAEPYKQKWKPTIDRYNKMFKDAGYTDLHAEIDYGEKGHVSINIHGIIDK